MAKTYTSNQTGAIAIQWGAAIWGLTAIGAALITAPPSLFMGPGAFWLISLILTWIWVPLMVKLVRISFLLSLIHWIVYYVGHIVLVTVIFQSPGWWSFIEPLYYFSYFVAWLAGLAGIYFNYKSYMELK